MEQDKYPPQPQTKRVEYNRSGAMILELLTYSCLECQMNGFHMNIDFREEGTYIYISDERESLIGYLLYAPYWGSSLQSMRVLLT